MRKLTIGVLGLMVVGCAEMGAPVEATGTVESHEGDGVADGESCRVAIVNEGRGRFVCRTEVECGGRTLYGGPMLGGYTHCEAREGSWVRVWDHGFAPEDGDPWVDWNLEDGTVVVRTRTGETRVRVEG